MNEMNNLSSLRLYAQAGRSESPLLFTQGDNFGDRSLEVRVRPSSLAHRLCRCDFALDLRKIIHCGCFGFRPRRESHRRELRS